MGIPSFFSYIVKRYNKTTLLHETLTDVERLFLDLNGIIHPSSHKVLSDISKNKEKNGVDIPQLSVIEDMIIANVIENICSICEEVRPSQVLYVAIDGVAPRAKMFQQRKRRFKASQDKRFQPTFPDIPDWDSNAITPGTVFMEKLNLSLSKSDILKKLDVPEIIISDSTNPKEGEHKLIEYIRTHMAQNDVKPGKDVIHGLDADLIMLSLMCFPREIYLLRDDSAKKQKFYFDILKLAEYIIHHFSTHTHVEATDDESKKRVLREYVFLCFFMGNDFLPHHYGLEIRDEAIDLMIETYCKVYEKIGIFLTQSDGNLNLDFLKEFVKALANMEDTLVTQRMERLVFKPSIRHGHTKEDRYNFYPDYHRDVEKNIGFGGFMWEKRYYEEMSRHVVPSGISQMSKLTEFIEEMCNFYIQGLVWNMKYYLSGCVSTTWYYPYLHAPLLKSLFHRLQDMNQSRLDKCLPVNLKKYTAFEQLLFVLPPQSAGLLPKNWRSIVENKRLWPERFQLDPIGSVFRWQCAPILYWNADANYLKSSQHRKLTKNEKNRLKQNKEYDLKKK